MENERGLSGKQRRALTVLARGLSMRDAARSAGVQERVVREWSNRDPLFRAARLAQIVAQAERAARNLGDVVLKGLAQCLLIVKDEDVPVTARLIAADALLQCRSWFYAIPADLELEFVVEELRSLVALKGSDAQYEGEGG